VKPISQLSAIRFPGPLGKQQRALISGYAQNGRVAGAARRRARLSGHGVAPQTGKRRAFDEHADRCAFSRSAILPAIELRTADTMEVPHSLSLAIVRAATYRASHANEADGNASRSAATILRQARWQFQVTAPPVP